MALQDKAAQSEGWCPGPRPVRGFDEDFAVGLPLIVPVDWVGAFSVRRPVTASSQTESVAAGATLKNSPARGKNREKKFPPGRWWLWYVLYSPREKKGDMMMRFVRTVMAVLPMLALSVPAYAQYGLYGAPSTLPLTSPQPVSQSTIPQNPPFYVDTNTTSGPMMASPVVANPAAQYANPAYANPAYANPAYANPAYANPAYANPAYAQSGYGHSTYPTSPPTANSTPATLPRPGQVPFDPAYSRQIVPASTMQAGQRPQLAPPPVRAPGLGQPMPAAPGPITQMLNTPETVQPFYDPSAGCGDQCGATYDPCCEPCCPTWFGSVAALYMGRNKPNRLWTTYETGNDPNQLPTDAFGSSPGLEVTIGRLFCCDTCVPSCDPCGPCGTSYGPSYSFGPTFGVEATYWVLDTMTGYTSQSVPGGTVSTPLRVSEIEFAGVNGVTYFDNAAQHIVRRQNDFQNLEINVFSAQGSYAGYGTMGCGACGGSGCSSCGGRGPLSLGWNLGLRYFRFEEHFLFGAVNDGRTWGEAGGIYEAYLEDNVRNSLLGFQFGCDFNYNLGSRWRIYAAPKLGIYNNHAENHFNLRRGDGVIANPTAASGMTGSYPVNSTEDALAFMSEIDLGIDWQVAPHWSVFLGYRVMFATGIALADNQIPTYVVDIPEIADIDTNGDLVLHGAFAGVNVNF